MTKLEAIVAMLSGKKVTHKWFSKDEWMTAELCPFTYRLDLLLEDGVTVRASKFWALRDDKSWDDGYSLWESDRV